MAGLGTNKIEVIVLEDGTVRVTSGDFPDGPQHFTADQFFKFVQDELGGEVKMLKGRSHVHGHGHAHDHDHVKAK